MLLKLGPFFNNTAVEKAERKYFLLKSDSYRMNSVHAG